MQPVKARRAICVGFVRCFSRVVKHEADMKKCDLGQAETLSAVVGIFRAGFNAVSEVAKNMSDIF